MFEPPDYAASLRTFVSGYEGSRERAVRLAPDVFTFYARLLVDDRLHRDARSIVSSVLAYFVVPDDVMPEAELGPLGLMDDLYAAAFAYRLLRTRHGVVHQVHGNDGRGHGKHEAQQPPGRYPHQRLTHLHVPYSNGSALAL